LLITPIKRRSTCKKSAKESAMNMKNTSFPANWAI